MKLIKTIPLLSLFILQFSIPPCSAQNLVPNQSFEEYYTCPNFLMQTNLAKGWIINVNSADYYNSCASLSSGVSVPKNPGGYQVPATGNAYCGLFNYVKTSTGDVREYIGTRLLTPLIPNQKYYVSVKVSWADGWCATNKLGVLFTNSYYGDSTKWGALIVPPPLVNNFAHIYSNSLIADSVNWINLNGSFIADSAYKYIYIGNFFSRGNTDTLWFHGGFPDCKSYYYIDDVCVSIDSLTCNHTVDINETAYDNNFIKIFPNPSNEKIIIKYNCLENTKCNVLITDLLGKYIKSCTIFSSANEISLAGISPGLYFVHLTFNNKIFTKKIIISKP